MKDNKSGSTGLPGRTLAMAVLGGVAVAGLLAWQAQRNVARSQGQRAKVRKARTERQNRPPEDRAPSSGDILLFFRPNRPLDYVIEWVTGSHFYHAALYAGRDSVVEARPKGVTHNSLAGREGEYVVLPAPGSPVCGGNALRWARTQLGDRFDRRDLIVIGLEHLLRVWKINYTRPGYYSCAELVATAFLRGAGVRLIADKELGEVAPSDLGKLLPNGGGDAIRALSEPSARAAPSSRSAAELSPS